ncbi:MAG: GNAT family N-acetyltransferase [Acidobacteriota bacterium]|nr:GNAT family N-acetyltransferase [Acidobacteriota bacterium]MDH3530294.1 GNAT family N-acetyltransferase [Acidobacteriota bacterium]
MFISYKVDDDIKLTYPLELNAAELARVVSESNEFLNRWVPWAKLGFTQEDALVHIQFLNEMFTKNSNFWVFINFQGSIAGGIGLNRFDLDNQATDLGYWLAENRQGHGIVTRACSAMIEYVFDDLGYNRIELRTSPDNDRSVAVANRLGFSREGVLRQAEVINNEYRDLELYSLLRHEWN